MSSEDVDLIEVEIDSPPWSLSTKVIVVVVGLCLIVLVAYRFQSLIGQLVVAAILAYILNPIIVFVDTRTTAKRSTVLIIIYLTIAVIVGWASVALGFAAVEQATSLIRQAPQLIEDGLALFSELTASTEPIVLGPFSVNPLDIPWQQIGEQILGLLQPVLGQGSQIITQAAAGIATFLGNIVFVFVISIYIANEIPRVRDYVGDLFTLPGYRYDADRLMQEFGRIWSAYLRGQIILGLTIFVLVWLGLTLMGVQNALALGILSGLLEFIPIIGPFVGTTAAMVVAFFQPDNPFGIVGWQFALLVLAFMFLVQQLENVVLVPRIVGNALDIHPLIVMVSVFMGGSIAGILGAILAAPVAATLKLIGTYAWHKLFDEPPFPDLLPNVKAIPPPEPEPEPKPEPEPELEPSSLPNTVKES